MLMNYNSLYMKQFAEKSQYS